MQQKSMIIASMVSLIIAGCSYNTPVENEEEAVSSISSSSVQSIDIHSEVDDQNFGISFTHPSVWGKWILDSSPSYAESGTTTEMTFSNLESDMRDIEKQNKEVRFVFRKYDDDEYRYEEVCDNERSIDLCDTTKEQDILKQKQQFIESATDEVDSIPATIREFYDVPSGYLAKEVKFYTPTHRVEIIAAYDIGKFLFSKGPDDQSLFDTAQKLLGAELNDPINTLYKMHPSELQNMNTFFEDVNETIESMKINN